MVHRTVHLPANRSLYITGENILTPKYWTFLKKKPESMWFMKNLKPMKVCTQRYRPVLYGGEMGPDLEFVAQNAGKTVEEVIAIHSSTEYLIYMLGFTPGFTYLGGMSEEIATPRLATPRVKIPGGSVGIAGAQTGVYPIDSPGGWQLIGRTPVRMYDPDRAEPILPQAGQYIKFYPIDQAEFDRIAALEANGGYVCKKHPREEAGK